MKTVIEMAREAGFITAGDDCIDHLLKRFDELVRADERKQFPDLTAVITWLENGCDPKEAAKELRLYADAIRARGNT